MLKWLGQKKRAGGLVGVSVTSGRIALAHVTRRGDDIQLEHCDRRVIENGQSPRDVLTMLVDEQGLRDTNTNCLLAPDDYNIYLVDAPQVPDNEMAAAIRWKIKDLLEMPVEEAVVDIFPLPDNAFQGRKKMVYAVVSNRGRIEQLIETVNRAGLNLVSIDVPEMAMRNITSHFADDSQGLAFISLKSSGSVMNITRGGQLFLTRKINTQIRQDALLEPDWDMMRDRLVLEVQRSLDYFESQMVQNPVTQIMIAPRFNDTESMMNNLADALAAPVGVLDFYNDVPVVPGISLEQVAANMLVIGAALRADGIGGGL